MQVPEKNTEKLIACIHIVTFYFLAIGFFAYNKIRWKNNGPMVVQAYIH